MFTEGAERCVINIDPKISVLGVISWFGFAGQSPLVVNIYCKSYSIVFIFKIRGDYVQYCRITKLRATVDGLIIYFKIEPKLNDNILVEIYKLHL